MFSAMSGLIFLELLANRSHSPPPQTLQAMALALGYPPELVLLMIPHT